LDQKDAMHPNREGQTIPDVVLRVRENGRWRDLSTRDVFAGKTVVAFSLPGAFTPTCSSSHVPRYDELAPLFFRAGVDEIVCISVNDAFVMDAWAREQDATNIRFLPDGNGELTRAMGMLVDKKDLGFGQRSWRYSMLVKDGVIEKMFVEPEQDGDPYEVSDADTMLDWLAPGMVRPTDIALLGRAGCPHCARAKALLSARGLPFRELEVNLAELRAITGRATTPQIFIDGRHIGGADDLETYFGLREPDAA
jgi:glutathione-dependent peroxiredoxin